MIKKFPSFTFFIYSLLSAACCLTAYAVEIDPLAGTTSASFLTLGVGSRANSMGTAFTGLADDVTTLYWNPAGLTQLSQRELSVTHTESFQDITNDFIGYAWNYKSYTLGAAIYALSIPSNLELRSGLNENDPFDPISPVEGYFGANDVCAQFSMAKRVSNNLSVGGSLKFIQQTIDDYSAIGGAIDVGAFYREPESKLSLGCGLYNFGTAIKFVNQAYVLPMDFRSGAAWRWNTRLTTTLDLEYPYDNFPGIAAGCEYQPLKTISLRAGYRYRLYGLALGDLSGMSLGMGLNIPFRDTIISFDYAFVPYGILGDSQRITLGIKFGPISDSTNHMGIVAPVPETAHTVTTDKPALPVAPPAPHILTADTTSYNYSECTVLKRLKRVSGHEIWHTLYAENTANDLLSFKAMIRSTYNDYYTIEVGYRDGTGPVYRSYRIRTNVPLPIERVSAKISLPSSCVNPSLKTENGVTIPLVKNSTIGSTNVYTFELPILQNFTIYYAQ